MRNFRNIYNPYSIDICDTLDDCSVIDDMISWCHIHIKRDYIDPRSIWGLYKLYNLHPDVYQDVYRFVFVHEHDLCMFALVWGSYCVS